MFGPLVVILAPRLSIMEALANAIKAHAIAMIARGDFSSFCQDLQFRLELISTEGMTPNGVRGATFRVIANRPSGRPLDTTFGIPESTVKLARDPLFGQAVATTYIH